MKLEEGEQGACHLKKFIQSKFDYLKTARPTAVNIAEAAERYTKKATDMESNCLSTSLTVSQARDALVQEMESILREDIATNKSMGASRSGAHFAKCARNRKGCHSDTLQYWLSCHRGLWNCSRSHALEACTVWVD